jgi:invasion protein IalB
MSFVRRIGAAGFAASVSALIATSGAAAAVQAIPDGQPPAPARTLAADTVRTAQAVPAPPGAGAPRLQTAPPSRSAQAPVPAPLAAAPAPAPAGAPAATPAAPPPPKLPARTEILNFDSWVVTCNEFTEPKSRTCSALLQIFQQNTKQVVFSWTVGLDNAKQVVTVLQTPTGVALPPGVELRLGKSPARKVPFASCDTGRCVATLIMDGTLLRDMAATPTAEAVIQGSQGNTVQFNIQMKGFDKAYAVVGRP